MFWITKFSFVFSHFAFKEKLKLGIMFGKRYAHKIDRENKRAMWSKERGSCADEKYLGLSRKCRRHVAICRHDMTCRSNFGQMGPCRRHVIEDVVAVCVGLSQHLPNFPKCVCRNILWYGSTYAQILNAYFCHFLLSWFCSFHQPPRSLFIR